MKMGFAYFVAASLLCMNLYRFFYNIYVYLYNLNKIELNCNALKNLLNVFALRVLFHAKQCSKTESICFVCFFSGRLQLARIGLL